MKQRVAAIFFSCCLLLSSTGRAELPWHALSLKVFGGPSRNGGTISRRGVEHEYELGFSGVMVVNEAHELELAFSRWNVKHRALEEYFEETANKLSLAARRKYGYPSLFVPWWQVGINWALIDTYKRHAPIRGEHSSGDRRYSLSAPGVHAGIGVDVYPVEYSALALVFDLRYTAYASNKDINQWGAFIGLRWDFFQRGLDRRNYQRTDAGDRNPLRETPVWMR